jgi:hypothetical protein
MLSPDQIEAVRRALRQVVTAELLRLIVKVEIDEDYSASDLVLRAAGVPPMVGGVPGLWAHSQKADVRALAECELNERVPTRT